MTRFRHEPTEQNALRAIRVYLSDGFKAVGSCEKRAVGLDPWKYEHNSKQAFRAAALAVLDRLSGDHFVEQVENLALAQDAVVHQSSGK